MSETAAGRLEIEIGDRAAFVDAVGRTLDTAAARAARTMLWVDPDFVAWPLDRQPLIDALGAWLRRPLRRLVMLSGDYEALERAHPRFGLWRRDWTHAIDARTPTDLEGSALPTLLVDDGPVLLELWERDPPKGRAATDAHAARAARQRIDAALQRSASAWPLRPLGI